jgi:hypothetical protein
VNFGQDEQDGEGIEPPRHEGTWAAQTKKKCVAAFGRKPVIEKEGKR